MYVWKTNFVLENKFDSDLKMYRSGVKITQSLSMQNKVILVTTYQRKTKLSIYQIKESFNNINVEECEL